MLTYPPPINSNLRVGYMILQQQQQQHENSRKAGLGQAGILNDWVLPAVEQQRQMLQQVPI